MKTLKGYLSQDSILMKKRESKPASKPASKEVSSLTAIAKSLSGCTRCKLSKGRTQIVMGEGNPKARLMFVGEAPGEQEDLKGVPFVGRAGQLLTQMITAMGLSREEVFIANVVKCRPPENRNPEPDEIESCEPFLFKQIQAIGPEIIVALGKFSSQTLLKTETRISDLRGKFHQATLGAPVLVMPTFHPAYLLRNPSSKKECWDDLKQVVAKLGLELPKK